jgi:hypothetical protein
MFARFVPPLLSPDQNINTLHRLLKFVEVIDDGVNVLGRVVTGDESWCFVCDPETKLETESKEPESSESDFRVSQKNPKAQKVTLD